MRILLEKSKKNKLVVLFVIVFLITVSINLYVTSVNINELEALEVELHSLRTPLKVGDRTTLQVLVYDRGNLAREDVNVEIKLSNQGTARLHEKFTHIENGLYETNIQFFHGGTWDGTVFVKKGNSLFKKNFKLFVER
ncbi:MAG: FixH family protein [Anaerobacillus sp.]|uniref:FixH family protein n=1 Tax=Anaerobacillus sp. TaxID=1872506 RepID=UPI00391D546D